MTEDYWPDISASIPATFGSWDTKTRREEYPITRLRSRYNASGPWFKGALHCHTTASDGRLSLDELVSLYRAQGFDFLCVTDHQRFSRVDGMHPSGLLLLDGVEAHCPLGRHRWAHVIGIGISGGDEMLRGGLHTVCDNLRRAGAILVLGHPHWSDLRTQDLFAYRYDGIEIYSYGSYKDSGKAYGIAHWDLLLAEGYDTLGFAVDDVHARPPLEDWCGGWVMVNAPRLDRRSIMAAIRRGCFYSSNGPEIHRLHVRRGKVELETSPISIVRLIGFNGFAAALQLPQGRKSRRLVLPLPSRRVLASKWRYVRLELEDARGKVAWTNTLFRVSTAGRRITI